MKIHSVQFKFLLTVILAILAIAIIVGGLCIYEVDRYVQQKTEDLVHITCENEAAKINDMFGDIEKSVRIMESYVLSLADKVGDIENRDEQAHILALAGEMFVDVAVNTEGAVAYYLRFDPAISDGKAGMFYSKLNGAEEYECLEPTDISIYDKNDTEHVGWFWQPYEAGRPIWMAPYYNQNNDILMISYVIPLYHQGRFIGVLGMDFDYVVLTDRVHSIKIYENGFAHLELDGVVAHNGIRLSDNADERVRSDDYLRVSQELGNGMTLVLSASYNDFWQIRYEITYTILITVILLALIFSLIVFFMVERAMRPLKSLTQASAKLANGEYDVEIAHSRNYEIQQLSIAFENMIMNLREHENLQHQLAYRDPMTGLRNTTSYRDWASELNEKLAEGELSLGMVVLDINCLKETNDTYGHNVGNAMIIAAAQAISQTFKRSPVFRVGGDEFAVLLQGHDLEERERLLAKLEQECAIRAVRTDSGTLPLVIAKGLAILDPTTDTCIADLFDRADGLMYENKKQLKQAAANGK